MAKLRPFQSLTFKSLIYAQTFAHAYMCMHVYVCMYVNVCVCMYVCKAVSLGNLYWGSILYVYSCIYQRVCVCVYVCMYVCVHTVVRWRVRSDVLYALRLASYTHTHTHTHTHTVVRRRVWSDEHGRRRLLLSHPSRPTLFLPRSSQCGGKRKQGRPARRPPPRGPLRALSPPLK